MNSWVYTIDLSWPLSSLEGAAEIMLFFFFFFHKKWMTEVSKYFRQNPAFTSLVRRKYFWYFILFIRTTIHFMDLNTKSITKMKETFLLSRSSKEHYYYIKSNQTIFSGLEYYFFSLNMKNRWIMTFYTIIYELVLLCHAEHYYWKPEMNVQTYRDTKVLYMFAKIIICCILNIQG